jgi:hypothetical protein
VKRVNNITSYDQLLSSMVGQMDNNVKLDCFAKQMAAIPNQ